MHGHGHGLCVSEVSASVLRVIQRLRRELNLSPHQPTAQQRADHSCHSDLRVRTGNVAGPGRPPLIESAGKALPKVGNDIADVLRRQRGIAAFRRHSHRRSLALVTARDSFGQNSVRAT